MQSPELHPDNRIDRASDEPPLSLAVAALEQATPADAMLAFKDAVACFARMPNADNARKVEVTMLALQRQRQQAEAAAEKGSAAF